MPSWKKKKKCSKWREIVMTQKEISRESYLIFYYIDEVDYTVSHFRITKFEHVLLVTTISSIVSFYFQAKSIKEEKYCFRKHFVCVSFFGKVLKGREAISNENKQSRGQRNATLTRNFISTTPWMFPFLNLNKNHSVFVFFYNDYKWFIVLSLRQRNNAHQSLSFIIVSGLVTRNLLLRFLSS